MRLVLAILLVTAAGVCGACGGGDGGQLDPDGGGGGGVDGGGGDAGVDAPSEEDDASIPAGDTYTLTVNVVGAGTVTSAPEGITCANPQGPDTADCTFEFADGETVHLTATPAGGKTFAGWAGDCDGDAGCVLVLDEPRYAAATFQTTQPQSSCPLPATGKVSLCGRVYDLEDSSVVGGVRMLLFDAEQFLGGTSAPIAGFTVPADGRFIVADLPPAPSGKFVVATDDTVGLHDRALTGVVVPAPTGTKVEGIDAFTLRRTTDEAWMAAAGYSFDGLTFSVQGVLVAIFVDTGAAAVGPFSGAPRAGVTVTSGGSAQATDDFPFTGTAALARTTPSASAAVTAASGAVLLVRSAVGAHSGTGGAPAGCTWPVHAVAAVPDAVVVQVFESVCP